MNLIAIIDFLMIYKFPVFFFFLLPNTTPPLVQLILTLASAGAVEIRNSSDCSRFDRRRDAGRKHSGTDSSLCKEIIQCQ